MKKTKKILSIILAVMMILTAVPLTGMTAFAEDCSHNYFHNKCTLCGAYHPDFVVDKNGVLTEYKGVGGDVIIPDGIKSICGFAFENADLYSVVIPASVESIDASAFYEKTKLSYVYFLEGSKLKTIGNAAFRKCGNDADNNFHIYIPASVTTNLISDQNGGCFKYVSPAYIHLDWDSKDEIVDVNDLSRVSQCKQSVTVPAGTLDLYNNTNWKKARGGITEHTHSFTGEYFDLGNGKHCRLCECCLYGGATEHTYVNGVCACGAVDPHKHTFATEWTTNSTAHWHECTAEDCNIKDYSTCKLDGAAYNKHTGLEDDNTCDTCGTVFYRPYDVTYTNSTINLKVNVLNSSTEPYTQEDCVRFDAFLRANNSGTAYDANMNFDDNEYYKGTVFPIGETETDQGYCVKNGATYTIVINAATFDKITDFDESNPYVWLILRPCHEGNGMDYGYSSVNMTYANFYDCSVCLGKFASLEDFKNVKPAEDSLNEIIQTHLNDKTVDIGGLMGRQGLMTGTVVSPTVGRTIIGLTQKQLEKIDSNLVIVGSDGEKQVNITVDCAYTYFYNGAEKIEAASMKDLSGEQIAAFVIIDNDGNGDTINGYGYYRIYNESAETEDNFLFDALYVNPNTK